MIDLTPEKREELRERYSKAYHRTAGGVIIELLDALDAKDAELASVRALSEAERAVVEAAVHVVEVWGESAVMWLPGMTSAVDALLARRKDQTDGD